MNKIQSSYTAETYEEVSLETLLEAYKVNALKLFVVGTEKNIDVEKKENSEEEQLMNAQSRIIENAIAQNIDDAIDIKSLLNIWYNLVVKERKNENLNPSDRLILKVYQNRDIIS